jgi:glycerophosphoryl diester phosphodiesterase
MYQIAHRGFSDLHRDNSMPAFYAAIDYRFDMIELDIQITKDKQIIIFHDTFIYDNLIKNMNLVDIEELDTDIVTLPHFFKNIDLNEISVYLDVKGDDSICKYLHNLLQHVSNKEKIIIGSFNLLILEKMFKLNENYNLGIITENLMNNEVLRYYIKKLNIVFVSVHWSILNCEMIKFLHMKNVLVFSYTCKNNNIKKFIEQYDIDGIVTNYKL